MSNFNRYKVIINTLSVCCSYKYSIHAYRMALDIYDSFTASFSVTLVQDIFGNSSEYDKYIGMASLSLATKYETGNPLNYVVFHKNR